MYSYCGHCGNSLNPNDYIYCDGYCRGKEKYLRDEVGQAHTHGMTQEEMIATNYELAIRHLDYHYQIWNPLFIKLALLTEEYATRRTKIPFCPITHEEYILECEQLLSLEEIGICTSTFQLVWVARSLWIKLYPPLVSEWSMLGLYPK